MLGKLGALLIKERFNSYDKIEKIECPTLIIHGKLDEVVSCSHAHDIFQKLDCVSSLFINQKMGHNSSDFFEDILKPVWAFFQKTNLLS